MKKIYPKVWKFKCLSKDHLNEKNLSGNMLRNPAFTSGEDSPDTTVT